jgi:dolichyl-phosphate-mannose-protein mannosyltransferase
MNLERTMFIFYIAPAIPFFILAVTLLLQDVLGPVRAGSLRRQIGLGVVSVYVAVVAATFVFFYPVLAGRPLSRADWLLRMWFPSWF